MDTSPDRPATPDIPSLDPADWSAIRAQAHQMLDNMFDHLSSLEQKPVWQPIPPEIRASVNEPLPRQPGDLALVHQGFMENILPYAVGNAHPRFMGWVHGGGTVVGMLAEMLAGGLNANLGGRDHMPIEVERQITRWMAELFGFPETSSGVFVTGSSMANFLALLVARVKALGPAVRETGLGASRLLAYTSAAAHGCIAQALDMAGLGKNALRRIPVDRNYRMDLDALREQISRDKASGFRPFVIVGTAGTVDVGAVDNLSAIARIAREEGAWFHVDGAFGALGRLSPVLAPLLAGIEEADSIAFDFHKWGQVPYDAGFLLVKDADIHKATFASPAAYLGREQRGLAAGSPWPCDLGPDLSRGFRALKTWFTLKVYGGDQLGRMMARNCELAAGLTARIENEARLELAAPVGLNIVCFRYRTADSDRINREIVLRLHESGLLAPSTTTLDGRLAIRAAIVNHRTRQADMDLLFESVLRLGSEISNGESS